MAEARRVRIEAHLEAYLAEQSERVLGKPTAKVTGADLTTLVNAIVYEHKLAQQMARKVPFAKLFNWLLSWVPGAGKGMVGSEEQTAIAPSPAQDFTFDADFADQFEIEEAV